MRRAWTRISILAAESGPLPGWIGDLTFEQAVVLLAPKTRAVNRNTFPSTLMSMPKTRTVVLPLGFLVAGLGLSGVSTSAQFQKPVAELTPTVEQQAIQPGQTVTLILRVELPE